ncbi:H-type lectin domain-containing protein [Microcoleus sp. S13C4]|uniref:H-type lectin domain-containing protein n=1 Tax=Microcoleus sp. S13C4 TaxID=3055410 RepID=UPI002FD496E7
MATWIDKLGDEAKSDWKRAKREVQTVRRYFVDKITGLKPKLGVSAGVDIDAALRIILDDSFLKVIDRITFALDQAVDKLGAEFQQLVKQVFSELSELADRIDQTIDKVFKNISIALADIKRNLVDPIVTAISDLEKKLVEDINQILDKLFDFFQGTVQDFKDGISGITILLIPNPFDSCRQETGTTTTLGPNLTPADIFNLFECNQLKRLEDSATTVKEITEVYASLQLQSFRVTCLGRGSPTFQDIYTKKWIKYGQLYDLWKEFDETMTAQQAFNEAIKRLDQARNEYLSNPAPKIESGSISKGYHKTGHPLELGTPVGARSDTIRVDFPGGKFTTPPKVQVMLNSLDTSNTTNTRLQVSANNITVSGFDIVVSTWSDSIVFGVSVAWFAYVE